MEDAAALAATSEQANELYWGSDLSVNQIAEKLDLSKGRLYEMIRPEATGLSCPVCGAEVHYPNRTAKTKAAVRCSECGFEGSDAELVEAAEGYHNFGDQVAAAARGADWRPSKRVFWGAVLLGAAAGIVLVRRRRDS